MAIFCQNSALQYGNYKSDIFIWIEFFDLLNVNQYLNFCNSTKTKIQMFYKHLLHQKWIWISINSTGIQSSLLCKFDQIYFIYPIAIFSGTLQYFESLLYCTVTLLSNTIMIIALLFHLKTFNLCLCWKYQTMMQSRLKGLENGHKQ